MTIPKMSQTAKQSPVAKKDLEDFSKLISKSTKALIKANDQIKNNEKSEVFNEYGTVMN